MDNNFEPVIAALQAAITPKTPGDGGVPFVLVPNEYTVKDLEALLPNPIGTKASVTVTDAVSFVAYVQAFADEGTRIFAHDKQGTEPKVIAVIDYPQKEQPRHGRHRVTLAPRISEQWGRWNTVNGKRMAQADFARFLEENSVDVRAPDAATLIEVAQSIDATKAGAFRSGIRLADGSFQLTYSEQVSATAGDGKLRIPEKITLGIPVFERGELYAVDAWFRYRIDEGKLLLSVDLHRPRFVFDDAFLGLVSTIKSDLTRDVLFGTP
jgi:uncharacterized protein YfdQ (DUF2303 family)